MSETDARARLAAQATDAERAAAADVLIINDGTPEEALAELDELWHTRLLPFAANLAAGVPAARAAADPTSHGREWQAQPARIMARLARAAGDAASSIGEAGAVELPGEPTGSILEIRLKDATNPSTVLPGLAEAGFFAVPGSVPVLLRSADPGLAVSVQLR